MDHQVHVLVHSQVKERAQIIGAPEEMEDEGSPSGGGDELVFLDGLAWLQIDSSLGHLTRSFRRIYPIPPLYLPPHAFLIKKKPQ
jgi:hypothetical protein